MRPQQYRYKKYLCAHSNIGKDDTYEPKAIQFIQFTPHVIAVPNLALG